MNKVKNEKNLAEILGVGVVVGDECPSKESCGHKTGLSSGNYKGCGFYKAQKLKEFLEEHGYNLK